MAEFRKLSFEEAERLGIRFSAKINDASGELRARITKANGADLTLTHVPATASGGWQNSHSHSQVVEVTTIIEGRAIQAERIDDGLNFVEYHDGDTFKTHPGRAHNLYVFPGTLMLTLKLHDNSELRDWIADPGMDAELQDITWDEALRRC
ncbi:MAG TPA: hypothetical protein VN086_00030 [Candidatus Paceibacterota bacterium]|nr:hypothetical protein [Candidatus Paceibacterota bacterium]